jgi:hypothetical protein
MSKELLLHQQEHVNPLQNEEEKEEENKTILHDNIEQEIVFYNTLLHLRYEKT